MHPPLLLVLLLPPLLGLPGPAAASPIRTVGVVGSIPIHMLRKYNSPCSDDEMRTNRCWGGMPYVSAWMRKLSEGTRGVVKFMSSDDWSKIITFHPKGWALNTEHWERIGIDFAGLDTGRIIADTKKKGSPVKQAVLATSVPLVATTISISDDMAHFVDATQRYYVKEVDGVRVGYLWLWSENYYVHTYSWEAMVPEIAWRLRRQGAELIVAILSVEQTYRVTRVLRLARMDVDVVLVPKPNTELPRYINGTTFLVHSGKRLSLAVLDAEIIDGLWTFAYQEVSLIDPLPPSFHGAELDSDFAWIEKEWGKAMQNDPYVAESLEVMPYGKNSNPALNCMRAECAGGNLVADAVRAANPTVDIAIINGGGARGGWKKGAVHQSNVYDLYPYSNHVCTFEATGPHLWHHLETGLSYLDPLNITKSVPGAFGQVSGARYTFNLHLPPMHRIVSLEVETAPGVYEPVSRRRVYTVAMSSFICDGGDGYDTTRRIAGTTEDLQSQMMQTVLIDYLREHSPYTPRIEGRARSLDDPSLPSLNFTELSEEDCTEWERHDPKWHDCVACPVGTWHPSPGSHPCIPIPTGGEGVNVGLVVGVVLGGVVLLAAPVVWKLTENRRRIRRLFNDKKVAEESAVAIARMQLEDLDYLDELQHPNDIQRAFITIREKLKEYRSFMPLLAMPVPSSDEGNENEAPYRIHSSINRSENSTPGSNRLSISVRSSKTNVSHNSTEHLRQGLRQRSVTILSINMCGFNTAVKAMTPEHLAEFHGYFITIITQEVKSMKGFHDLFTGDRMTASWNAVQNCSSHQTKACNAAAAIAKTFPHAVCIGIAASMAQVGTLGITGCKKVSIIGSAVSTANLLMVAAKEHGGGILLDETVREEASYTFYTMVHDRLMAKDGSFVAWSLREAKELGHDEWMYDQEGARRNDPYAHINKQWELFLEGESVDRSAKHPVLERLVARKVKGKKYVCKVVMTTSM